MDPSHSIIGIIPARYSSSRFPGKMLVPVAGKTLIQRTFENTQLCSALGQVIVATDDQRIYDHVVNFGGNALFTCPDCPTGTDRIADALKRNPSLNNSSIIVNVQGDEPCINPLDIHRLIEALKADPTAVMATAVTPLLNQEEANAPSVVKCVFDKQGNALYFSRTLIPSGHRTTMQPSVCYYRHVGIYCFRKEFLPIYTALPPTDLQLAEDLEQLKAIEHGFRIKTVIIDHPSIGIDVPEDIQKVEQWLHKQNIFS